MDINEVRFSETPHISVNSTGRSSHDSVDSGYLTLTPRSASRTPMGTSRNCTSAKRYYMLRPGPWQCERIEKYRSRINHFLNTSDSYLISKINEQESILESPCTSINQSLNLVHSTPSCANQDLISAECGVKSDKVLQSKNRNIWRTAITITTPASTDFQMLSPPPSPASPSSSSHVASKSIEDVEMKYHLPMNGTPRFLTPSKKMFSAPRIIITPTRKRASPTITSEDNRKLSKLSIIDLESIPEIMPKRLDFNLRSSTIKSALDYTGRDKVDIFSLLGEKSNHWRIISKILSFLGPQDLCAVSMVSKVWRRICKNDSLANLRRIGHIVRRQSTKENVDFEIKMAKLKEDMQLLSPKSRCYGRKGYLLDVQNLLQNSLQSKPPNSPPVSPSKVKFHSFVKVSQIYTFCTIIVIDKSLIDDVC